MATSQGRNSDSAVPPSSAWIRFLRSYGPTPNNLTLFDEFVTDALGKARVSPISLTSPLLSDIKSFADSGKPGSILIAGTAGDGKTYHCRSLWTHLGGPSEDWHSGSVVKELKLEDGRTAVFVKDLSELNDEQSDKVLTLLEDCVLNDQNANLLVVAANHGQILDRLRDLGARQGRVHPLRLPIQNAFLQFSRPPDRLSIFDLSRASGRETVKEVLRAVAAHPEWSNCARCSLQTDGRVCPILENRNRVLGEDDDGNFGHRLSEMVEVARLNGWHLPVRDLLALAANTILGHPNPKEAKEGLMACSDVARIQENGSVERASLYENVFGSNLPARRANRHPVFRALGSFGVGGETTNAADGLLVYGNDDPKLVAAFRRLVRGDMVFGASNGYLASLNRYLEGEESARSEEGADEFLYRLRAQRRRLFFTVPAGDPDYGHWTMTVFQGAGDFLSTCAALRDGKAISEVVRSRLVCGLNRVMTGLLIENTDKLFIASSGGFSQSRISVLCDTEAPARRLGGLGMKVMLLPLTGQLALEVALAIGQGNSVTFILSPVRFEFLFRVADGALPGSFSNECLEDMLAFKAKVLRKAELIRARAPLEDDEPGSDAAALTLNFIEMEQNGHGFSRPVTLKVGA